MLIKQKNNELGNRVKILEGLALSEKAIKENRVVTHAEAREWLIAFIKIEESDICKFMAAN